MLFLTSLNQEKNPLSGIKEIDGNNMPFCHSVLLQQIKRTNYICSFWNKARNWNQVTDIWFNLSRNPLLILVLISPAIYRPENSGWILTEEKFVLNWFEGEIAAACLEDIVAFQNEDDEEVEDGSSDDDRVDDSEDN